MATAPVSSPPLLSPQGDAPRALQSRLGLLTKRRNAVVVARALMRALVPGVWISAIGITLYKTHIIPDAPVWAPLAVLGVCAAWGLRSGLARRDGAFRAALDADATLGLKDALGSALSFVAPDAIGSKRAAPAPKTFGGKLRRALWGRSETFHAAPQAPPTPLVPALVADAATRAQTLDPRRVYSFRFDRAAKALAVGTVLLVGSLFVPDFPLFASKKELADRTNVMKAGERLAMLSKGIEKRAPKDPQVAALNKKLQALGLKMARGRMTKRAALTSIGELKQQLQKAGQPPQQKNGANQAGMPQIPEAIKQAPMQSPTGQKVQRDLLDNKAEEAARELERLADKLEKGQLSRNEREKAAKDLEEVARQLRQRGGQANENAAQKLEQAARQLRQPNTPQQPTQQQGQHGQNPQQNPQGGQKNSQHGQQEQQQQPQDGQKNGQQQPQGQQGQGQHGQQGQQQQPQGGHGQQQGGKQGQKPSDGSQGQGQQPDSKGQSHQQGGQGQSPHGQKGGQPNQSPSGQGQQNQGQSQQGSQSGQQGSSPQGQQGQQNGQSGGAGQGQGEGEQGQSNASGALRDMANALRQGGGGGGSGSNLRDMMNNLRQAENGANGQGDQNLGNLKPSELQGGECPGGNCKTLIPGKDLVPTDPHGQVGDSGPGLGPRSHATGTNSGGRYKAKIARSGDKRRYEDEWSDRVPGAHSRIDRVKGKFGQGGEVEQLPTRGDGKGGQARTPYYDVYESYKRDAEDAVGRETVPPAYKAPVKDYFESIKP